MLGVVLSMVLYLSIISPYFTVRDFTRAKSRAALGFGSNGFHVLMFTSPRSSLGPYRRALSLVCTSVRTTGPSLIMFANSGVRNPSPILCEDGGHIRGTVERVVRPIASRGVPFTVMCNGRSSRNGISGRFRVRICGSVPNYLTSRKRTVANYNGCGLPVGDSSNTGGIFGL